MRVHQNHFLLDIPNVSALKAICSRELYVHDIPWTVYVRKEEVKGEKWLGVYLRCAKRDTSSKWSIVASPTFKLVSFIDNVNPIEIPLVPYVFDCRRMDHGIRMLRWNDLLNINSGYMINDTIFLEVKITMAGRNNPNKSELIFEEIGKSCEEGYRTKFRLTVTNIEHLMAVRTPEFMLRNTLWHVIINKYPTNGLALILEECMAKKNSREFPCKVNILAKLMNIGKPIEEIQSKEMRYLDRFTVLLASWNDLLTPENGFVRNNSIVIEVEISAETPKSIYTMDRKRKAISKPNGGKLLKLECTICLDSFGEQELSFTPCGHMFCSKCIQRSVQCQNLCPLCNGSVSLAQLKRAYLPRAKKA
ncbi:uncharacterized protein LOC129565792 [Sitodiplosis mosellana]|uniref:uncharacterized protein LOC129565792 n=1 Tax=Sitodiplosis mosellana TaxID=263140 RepID=UPI0024441AA1|nr:uncharacterized protein LOC129565792 [Sitodiplosis mosellana]